MNNNQGRMVLVMLMTTVCYRWWLFDEIADSYTENSIGSYTGVNGTTLYLSNQNQRRCFVTRPELFFFFLVFFCGTICTFILRNLCIRSVVKNSIFTVRLTEWADPPLPLFCDLLLCAFYFTL